MEENNIENLVRTAPFIDKTLKEECSDYLKKQVPKGLDHQIYSLKVFESPYQGELGSVPVEELEAGKEYDMTVRVRIESDVAKMETKPCLWVVIDGDSRKLEAWLRHAKPTFRKAGE